MVKSLCVPSSNSRTVCVCVNIFMSKVLSPNLSRYLNKISTSKTLLSLVLSGLKLNIPAICFMIGGCLFSDG